MLDLAKLISFLDSKEHLLSFQTYGVSLNHSILRPSQIVEDCQDPHLLFWLSHKNLEKITTIKRGIIISSSIPSEAGDLQGAVLCCKNPRLAFSSVIRSFFAKPEEPASIGFGNVIESNVKIGERVKMGHNNVILDGTIIGDDVRIGSNNTIGGVGFGYEKDPAGNLELIPHIGGVIIENSVEIGNNTCIDRAVLGNTIIRKNTKIDNLVHIAHGVEIGENSLIIANSMIAGSVKIGENVWIAPSTSIINGCVIDSNSMTGVGSVVLKKVNSREVVAGVPAKKIKDL